MLANPMMFLTTARDKPGLELEVWTEAQEQKVGVRFGPALMADDWTIPRYIPEGLVWFAVNDSPPPLLPFGRFSRSCNGSPVRVSLEATGVYSLDLAFALDAEGAYDQPHGWLGSVGEFRVGRKCVWRARLRE
jgi:hypothetical protein